MKRERQAIALCMLAVCGIALLWWLTAHPPTVHGQPLPDVELTTPLSELLPNERPWLFRWLAWDYAFAAVYTVFYACMLRWLARGSRSDFFDTLGRTLSWFVAIAVAFDVCENLILWVGGRTGATHLSPWLPTLVTWKWASGVIFFSYVLGWLIHFAVLPAPRASAPS